MLLKESCDAYRAPDVLRRVAQTPSRLGGGMGLARIARIARILHRMPHRVVIWNPINLAGTDRKVCPRPSVCEPLMVAFAGRLRPNGVVGNLGIGMAYTGVRTLPVMVNSLQRRRASAVIFRRWREPGVCRQGPSSVLRSFCWPLWENRTWRLLRSYPLPREPQLAGACAT